METNIVLILLTFNIFLQLQYRLCYSTTQSLMNNTEIHNYSDTNVESNLTKLYDELIEILNNDVSNISQFNTSQSRNRRLHFPGTLWCGVIKLTVSNDEIGYFFDTDMCCKEHELCPREKYYLTTTTTRPKETTPYNHNIFYPIPPQTTIHYPTAPYPTYYPPPHQLPHYPTSPPPAYHPYYPQNYPQFQPPHLPPYEGPNKPYFPHLPQPPHLPHSSQPIQQTNQQGFGLLQQNPLHYLPPPSARKNTQPNQQTPLPSSSFQPTQTPMLQSSENYTQMLEQYEPVYESQQTSTLHSMPSTELSKDYSPQLSQRMKGQVDEISEQQGVQLVSQTRNNVQSQETEKELENSSRMMRFPKASNLHQRWAVGDSDCECDLRFYSCLKQVDNLISRKVGVIYFNLLHSQCITFDHPVVRCSQRQGFMGWRCIDYQVDNTKPMVSQWRDNPYFHVLT